MRIWIAALPVCAVLAGSAARAEWSRLPAQFSRTYEGEIDGKHPVRLTLTKKGQQLRGTYQYTRVGKPLQLQGTINGEGVFTLDEFDAAGKKTGQFRGEFAGPTRLEGSWSRPGRDNNLHFYAHESLRKPTDARGPFSGFWSMGGPDEGPNFSLDLFQRGSRIEGLYHAITRNATRLDTDSPVVGTVRGNIARVEWTSGYSGVRGTATLRLGGNRVTWTLDRAPQGEYWAPPRASLTRAKR